MLIQSHTGIVRLFPAIPQKWKDVAFNTLRTEGAFLVSAKMEEGNVVEVEIISKKGGQFKLANPFLDEQPEVKIENYSIEEDIIIIDTEPGQMILLKI